tara:strand:- start:285 stop:482 length:198 start_codon:yes stop_codon:yes gene_type:complete
MHWIAEGDIVKLPNGDVKLVQDIRMEYEPQSHDILIGKSKFLMAGEDYFRFVKEDLTLISSRSAE